MPGLTMINYEKIKKGQTGIYYPEALLFLYHLVETLVSLHLSPQYRACGSDTSPSLPSPLCIFLSFFPFSSHPPLFPCVTSIFIRQKQDLHQPACRPACQAHQRDVGQQRVQTLRRNILVTLHHAVVLRGQREMRRVVGRVTKRGRETERVEEEESD